MLRAADQGAAEATTPDAPDAVVRAALAGSYALEIGAAQRSRVVHLDTPDFRLAAAGIDLVHDRRQGRLVARTADTSVEQAHRGAWPRLATDLPEGPVRQLVARPAWVRTLLPYATTAVESTPWTVLDSEGKTVARVHLERATLTQPSRAALPVRAEVVALRGYSRPATRVRRALAEAGVSVRAGGWYPVIRDLLGRSDPARPDFAIRPDQSATHAVAAALLGHLDTVDATVDGVVADLDTEYLHDLRVAVRKSRSLLKRLGDLLPADATDWAVGEFRWLGAVTTPTRDLDVYLLSLADLAREVSRPADLDALGRHVRRLRAAEQRALARALRSARTTELRARWRATLTTVLAAPAPGLTASRLARRRVRRLFATVARRAGAIDPASSADDIHALRKAVKELRYLLETFRPISDPKAYRAVLGDFKALQDVLGAFQDGEVQAAALRTYAEDMLADGTGDAAAILAMGELAGHFDDRQRAARDTLVAHHEEYLGPRAAAHIDRLVPR